jgi:hypothetical protein
LNQSIQDLLFNPAQFIRGNILASGCEVDLMLTMASSNWLRLTSTPLPFATTPGGNRSEEDDFAGEVAGAVPGWPPHIC